MAKKLFKNYTFTFDANEKKVLTTFCKQALKQMVGNPELAKQAAIFESILSKLESGEEEIKLTKTEKNVLVASIKENVKFLKSKLDSSSFFTKWFYKSVYKQYVNLLANHFEE
jgi:arginyl-tRNA synthetase